MCRIGLVLVILSLVYVQGIYSDIIDTPYMAAVFWLQGDDYRFHCNGAIISSRHVLTTATCAGDKVGFRNIMVRVGSSHHLYGGQEHFVESVNRHFKFNPDLDADIAVLRLSEPLKLGSRVALVNLPERDLLRKEVLLPEVIFYNDNKLSDASFNSLDQYSTSYTKTNPECNDLFKPNYLNKDLVSDNMICIRPSTYPRDRLYGAPWVYNRTIYGLCSWKHRTSNDDLLIFTRVAAFTDWIKNWIE